MTNATSNASSDWETYIDLQEESAHSTGQQEPRLEVDTAGTEAPEDPYTVRTRHSLSTSPYSQGIVVVSCALLGVSIFGLGFKLITGGFTGNSTVTEKPKTATQNPLKTEKSSNQEIAELKTQMAIATQAAEIQKLNSNQLPVTKDKARPSKSLPSAAFADTTPSPRFVSYSPPRSTTRPITPSASVTKLAPLTSPQTLAQSPSPPAPVEDPMKQWLAAANMGSYEGISPQKSDQAASYQSTDDYSINNRRQPDYHSANSKTENSDWQEVRGGTGTPSTQIGRTNQDRNSVAQSRWSNLPNPSYQLTNYSSATKNLAVGTKAGGKLETPIAWNGSMQNPTQNFVIQLKDPLKAADKSVAIPKGARLLARVSNADQAGLIQMSAVALIVNENGRTREKPLPQGAILILGNEGKPLQAKVTRRRGSNDLGMAVLRGVSRAAELVNRSTSQSEFRSGDSFYTTSTNDDRNYLAGFGQGATQGFVEQMQKRDREALQATNSQPRVFALNQGTSVQVFVNQPFSF